ncbi:MAG: hydrogenase maturation protease [Enhygromyxa sp.]
MTRVRVIALGSPHGGDDEAALAVARALANANAEPDPEVELILAGRPGAGLVDLLDTAAPIVLLDVVRSAASAGTIVELPLHELHERALAADQVSSHGFGPAEALRLAAALGRPLPRGCFLGIEGQSFDLGAAPSPAVRARLPEFERRARAAIAKLAEEGTTCTNPG